MATTVVVTAKGREVIAGRMTGSATEPKQLGWGTGGVAGGPFTAATTDVAPFQEAAETRVAGTSSISTTTTTNDSYQVVGTITSLSAQTIAEVFLSDSATKPFATTWATAPTGTGGTTGTLAASYTPANNTFIQCRTEVMQVTAGTGTTSVTLTRAQNGSAAVAQSNGDAVTLGNPPGTATANATLYVHASFTGLALNTGDSLQSTITVKHS
jgi:hypothetical protein